MTYGDLDDEEKEDNKKMELKSEVKIIMKRKLKDTLDWLVENYPEEISGWITGEATPEGIILDEFLMPYQEISSVSVDTGNGDLVKLRKEYGKKCEKIIAHFHSHHSMGAFWSSTDDTFIEQHMGGRKMRIFLVGSNQGGTHYKVRLELREPFHISMDNLDFEVEKTDSPLGKELQADIDKKVTKKVYKYETETMYGNQNYGNWNDSGEVYGRDLNQGKKRVEEILDIETERVITAKVMAMTDLDTSSFTVTLQDLNNEFFQEIFKSYRFMNPKPTQGLKEAGSSLVFSFPSKKKAKRFFRDIKVELADMLREESQTQLTNYNSSKKMTGTEYDYDNFGGAYGSFGSY